MSQIYCLHGFLGEPSDWNFLKGSIVAPVLFKSRIRSFEEWAVDFNRSIHPKEQNILVGYSLGGRLALHAAIAAPELWQRVIIISAHPGLTQGRAARRQSDAVWAERFAQEPWEKVVGDWNRQGVLADTHVPLREEKAFDRSALAQSLITWSLGRQKDLRKQIQNLRLSLLWVVGEKDAKFRALGQSVCTKGKTRLVVIPNAGHRVIFDQPEIVRSLVYSS